MAGNNRVFYALHYIAIGPYCSASGVPVHGLQQVSCNTTFNPEPAFELGQLDVYEYIENVPTIEMTAEKVIDGYPLIYHLASTSASAANLLNRTNQRCDAYLSIFPDTYSSASGTPMVQAYCSGLYLSSLNYNLPVNGSATESVTFVGNDKVWITPTTSGMSFAFNGHFDNTDAPANAIQRRQHIKMGNAAAGGSVWPTIIPGITVTASSGYNIESGGSFGAHIQDVAVSSNLGREDLFELGRKRPYYKYLNLPVAINCTINITAGGTNPGDLINAAAESNNLTNEPIIIHLNEGTTFDLGHKNKLNSVTYSGGNTGGGVATVSYNFTNMNNLTVTATSDPSHLA